MNFSDPFTGYSVLLRVIVYVVVPAFTILQIVRLRRALHVFQLEGYKRRRFLDWCMANPRRARWLDPSTAKKPLAMTGRAWRLLVTAAAATPILVLVPSGLAHLYLGGFPADIAMWATVTTAVFVFTSHLLIAADWLLSPLQSRINRRYMQAAARQLSAVRPLVVGITGSYGKTSTKFAVARLIGPEGTALSTPGSYNTPLGVCRTINERLEDSHRFFVVEMGAYGEGEIAELCRFVHPGIGVLTAIGPAHLERFGSMDAIRRAKYEIVTSLPTDGTAVMNVDDPDVRRLADGTSHVRVVRYGLDDAARPDVTAADVRTTREGTAFTVIDSSGASVPVETRLLGRHSVGHVLAGVAVALCARRRLEELRGAIESLAPVEHRLQLIDGAGGVKVIDDAYNSNPDGASAALDVLDEMPGNKKVVVTPGIIELGPLQADANRDFGRHAAGVADVLIVVAPVNRDALTGGARDAADGCEVIAVESLTQATQRLGTLLEPGDVVLFENDLPDHYEG